MERYAENIGVDFDGTMATYDGWKGPEDVGNPVPEMVRKIQEARAQGSNVWIFTARVNPQGHKYKDSLDATTSVLAIAAWCMRVFGELLPITHEKNPLWQEIWDDRGRQVIENTGVFATELLAAHGTHR